MTNENEAAPSSRWLVYQVDGAPLGPIATEDIADAILTGKLAPDTLVSAPAASKWLRATAVPVIATLLEGSPTRRSAPLAATVVCPPVSLDESPDPPETIRQ